jgi:hypothetical protein
MTQPPLAPSKTQNMSGTNGPSSVVRIETFRKSFHSTDSTMPFGRRHVARVSDTSTTKSLSGLGFRKSSGGIRFRMLSANRLAKYVVATRDASERNNSATRLNVVAKSSALISKQILPHGHCRRSGSRPVGAFGMEMRDVNGARDPGPALSRLCATACLAPTQAIGVSPRWGSRDAGGRGIRALQHGANPAALLGDEGASAKPHVQADRVRKAQRAETSRARGVHRSQ